MGSKFFVRKRGIDVKRGLDVEMGGGGGGLPHFYFFTVQSHLLCMWEK